MESLSLHIEYLLLRHDCVILPGIGAFINIYKAPYFDTETGKIIPPSREIRFNPALRSDDGMLANSIARKLAVPYREGSDILARKIATLGQTLLIEKEVTVGRLGIIRREQEGNIIFYPFKSEEKRCNELGLVSAPFVKNSPQDVEGLASVDLSKDSSVEDSSSAKTIDLNKISEDDKAIERIGKMNFKRNYYIPINKVFIKSCACLILVIALAVGWLNYPYASQNGEERASVLPIDKVIDSVVQKNHSQNKVANSVISESEPAETDCNKNIADKDSLADKNAETYNLIVATCSSQEEAMTFIRMASPSGYELKIIPSTKLFRVSAASSSNRQELAVLMKSPEFKQAFKESWILEKR